MQLEISALLTLDWLLDNRSKKSLENKMKYVYSYTDHDWYQKIACSFFVFFLFLTLVFNILLILCKKIFWDILMTEFLQLSNALLTFKWNWVWKALYKAQKLDIILCSSARFELLINTKTLSLTETILRKISGAGKIWFYALNVLLHAWLSIYVSSNITTIFTKQIMKIFFLCEMVK